MKMKQFCFGRTSALLAAASVLFFGLVMFELPRNDGVEGYYLNMLLAMLEPSANPTEMPEWRALSPYSITEERIVTALLLSSLTTAFASISAGLIACKLKERSAVYAGPVALCVVLLLVSIQYRWVFAW